MCSGYPVTEHKNNHELVWSVWHQSSICSLQHSLGQQLVCQSKCDLLKANYGTIIENREISFLESKGRKHSSVSQDTE